MGPWGYKVSVLGKKGARYGIGVSCCSAIFGMAQFCRVFPYGSPPKINVISGGERYIFLVLILPLLVLLDFDGYNLGLRSS